MTVVHPETKPQPQSIPLKSNSVAIPPPGYSNFNKRIGVEEASLGGRPRSLEFGEDESENKEVKSERVAKDLKTTDEEEKPDAGNSLEEEKNRRRRSAATDGNGNRILSIRHKRETSDEESSADIEMSERVIRVLAPSDVQFQLTEQDKEKVLMHTFNAVFI